MLDRPEVTSDPVAVRFVGDTNQPFVPFEPLRSSPTDGETVSTLAVEVPIVELSPYEDNAQKEKLLLPSFKGTLQLLPEQAKTCPLSEPSIARMV